MSLPILDVAIGISFFYLLLALICTTVNEMLAGWTKRRAAFLDRGIARLLGNDEDLKAAIYDHALIRSISPGKTVCPSYLPASKFATVLLDILGREGKSLSNVSDVQQAVAAAREAAAAKASVERTRKDQGQVKGAGAEHAPAPQGVDAGGGQLATALSAVVKHEVHDPGAARSAIEQWFDDGMDRVSGAYKRRTQVYTLILAGLLTLVLNADTIHIARVLWISPTTRAALVEEAKVRSQKARPEELLPLVEYDNPQDPTQSKPVDVPTQALSEKEQALLGELTGWTDDWQKLNGAPGVEARPFFPWLGNVFWRHGIGWLLTGVAVSIGAPFWFDTLNRFMNIRNAGRAPDEPKSKSRPAKA